MNAAVKILTYELSDVLRSRWVLGYALFFLFAAGGLLRFGGDGARALLSLMNVVLFVVPLVSLVYGTVYLYGARDFTELLLVQPVSRGQTFAGLYGGLALPLAGGFAVGLCLPFALHGVGAAEARTLALLVLCGVLLTLAFVALAAWIAVRFEDRMKGLGAALGLWLFFTVVYDGLVLLGIRAFAAYPLETPVLVLTLLNPVDLARVALLLTFDAAALMGYTGAVFEAFFGTWLGLAAAAAALASWTAVPLWLGGRAFRRKDF